MSLMFLKPWRLEMETRAAFSSDHRTIKTSNPLLSTVIKDLKQICVGQNDTKKRTRDFPEKFKIKSNQESHH